MATGLRIKQVADATGLTAATLRYYEQIGLLPEVARTEAGYRTYDRRTLERLAFISRAKQLGCTLDEIAVLTTAWDGGRCGPVQDQLRELVGAKIAAAHEQIGDLITFAAELQRALTALERHRPEGPCDADCGCVTNPATPPAATPTSVQLSAEQMTDGADIACTLPAGSMRGRIEDWRTLLEHVDRRDRVDGGVRCMFDRTVPTGELMRLVAAEQDCCRFFAFTITVDTRGVALEVRGPDDAREVVASMFGMPA